MLSRAAPADAVLVSGPCCLAAGWLMVVVFGVEWWIALLTGVTTPLFRGPADRRWWHVDLGDDTASWAMDVRVDEITGVRFVREPYPFPSFPGREVLTVQFLGPGGRRCAPATYTTCMTASRCARRAWRPGAQRPEPSRPHSHAA